ncbi:glutamyl-tRNA(Gln) amidotransferase subunit B, mitochondrial [Tribolium madens]|uniref:glutamyl-tRNA(Gln) amidotransferase subunit B, mitochondrial n=1 Tax=Tribolium madens TaxID=41895 RepID=UPI001CF72F24|nr:glutamyl-tRNA(Gln) amidotransferase subunit B, mitochondrial [Tribolium madens]
MFNKFNNRFRRDCHLCRPAKRLFASRAGVKNKWNSVVGLEVHAQINTASKLFSGASTKFSSPTNTNVSLFDCAIPGTLPLLNRKCVEYGVLTALALKCRINPVSTFDRKHYFYADIPAGYQITQQRHPLANDGCLEFQVFTPGIHKTPYKTHARIKQLQLEQDSGKSLHDTDRSLVDLNRAGAPLMEVVFEPDLSDGEEAAALVKELIAILQRIGTCTCKMEEGALRVDANVSVNRKGEALGVRTEIKNIGSVRGVAGAIRYEIERQIEVKEAGGAVENETRAWDALGKVTVSMRDKEQVQDYRYMPEPNLPPLHVAMGPVSQGCVSVDTLKNSLPELPEETRCRLRQSSGLTLEQSIILVNDTALLNLFEDVLSKKKIEGKLLANLLINEYTSSLTKMNLEPSQISFNSDYFGEIAQLLQSGDITRNTAKLVLVEIIQGRQKRPLEIVEENNWLQITDEDSLRKLCQEVLDENEKVVKQYKGGKSKVFKAFLGFVATKSKQRADMKKCDRILRELLEKK